MSDRELLVQLYRAALDAAHGERAVRRSLRECDPGAGPFWILGAGKAACAMAQGALTALGDRIAGGQLVTKQGHAFPVAPIEVREASHPVPDARGVSSAREALAAAAAQARQRDLLVLVSGGASALWTAPAGDVALEDKQRVTELLLRAGADISALNTVRKHLSRIKGGGLVRAARGQGAVRRLLTLLLSDVDGDCLDLIGSGPTAPDRSTHGDALRALDACGVMARTPSRVREHLERGARGDEAETAKPGDPVFEGTEHRIVATLASALEAVAQEALRRGLRARVLEGRLSGEARDEARRLASEARRAREDGIDLLVTGGEPVVHVRGSGRGGRAQELALAFALEVAGEAGLVGLFAGTDGTDGPTPAAGAIVDGATQARARVVGLDAPEHLERNDSYPLLRATGDLVLTGPTHTNVSDVAILWLGRGSVSGRAGAARTLE